MSIASGVVVVDVTELRVAMLVHGHPLGKSIRCIHVGNDFSIMTLQEVVGGRYRRHPSDLGSTQVRQGSTRPRYSVISVDVSTMRVLRPSERFWPDRIDILKETRFAPAPVLKSCSRGIGYEPHLP